MTSLTETEASMRRADLVKNDKFHFQAEVIKVDYITQLQL